MIETILLLGVKVSRVNLDSASQQIFQWIKEKKQTYVCVAPVATLVDANRDPAYAAVVNAAGMVTPDGMPVVWLARAKGCRDIERTYGPDLMRLVCKQFQQKGLRHFFYGSTEKTLVQLQQSLKEQYLDINIVGVYSPSFQSQAVRESDEVIRLINESKADVLWVGLGSPKQDFWMSMHRPLLDVPVIVGAGAAFDFLSGCKPQAPVWMQRSGLEWVFRLGCEPQRLWRRYLIGNTLFIFYILRDLIKRNL
ncbi:MAG: WecB/TagA/CpsF family glycosyltransferase [Candidatus Omnitrophica bacterium]|nr:WecB/TagA/CpsF family glycosyltransferase [Candidatus Omnitrophota bacterium]